MLLKNKFKIISSEDLQTTIAKKIELVGFSAYSRQKARIELMPAPEDTGIIFQVKNIRIPALINYAKNDDKTHTTSLVKNNIEIKSVEHLLSAIWGMGIDNIIVKMHSSHLPFLDASAKSYTKAIKEAQKKTLNKPRRYLKILKKIVFSESPKDQRKAIFLPGKQLFITSTTSFNSPIGQKTIKLNWTANNYFNKISWARTFLRSPLDDEGKLWDYIRKLFPNISNDPKKSPIIVYNRKKFIIPLHAEDEPARHKVLDFIGDISLLGYRMLGKIDLFLPGHRFTRQIVKKINSSL